MEKVIRNNTRYIIFAIIASILLVISNSAIWVNQYIFDTGNFTSVTTKALLSDSSRNALGDEVVDQAFSSHPALESIIGDKASALIAAILGTSLANTAITKVVTFAQTEVTSSNPKTISFDLSGVKQTVSNIIGITGISQSQLPDVNIPNQITLINGKNIPHFYKIGTAMLWIAPIAFLIALGLFIWPHYKRRTVDSKLLIIQGAIVIIAGLLAYLIGPLFRPPLLAHVSDSNLRVVVQNIYNAFIATFNSQTDWIIILGVLMVIAGIIVLLIKNYHVYSRIMSR